MTKDLAIKLASVDGGRDSQLWYYRDANGRGIGTYNVGSGPTGTWASLFKQPFEHVQLSNEDYWLTKTGHLNMDQFFK